MKILLVGIGRCGTISLSNAFGNQKYHVIPEPFSMDNTHTNVNEKKFQSSKILFRISPKYYFLLCNFLLFLHLFLLIY